MPPNSASHSGATQASMADRTREGLQNKKRWVKRYRTEVAASMSSVLSTFAAVSNSPCCSAASAAAQSYQFPLDSVKTRMQTYKYNSFIDCVKHTYRTEKFRGFFRGVAAPMASVTLVRTISFSVYQRSKYTYAAWLKQNFGMDPLVHVNTPGTYPNLATVACFGAAGATAGSFITLVACPFELTKVSAQVSVLLADKNKSNGADPKSSGAVAASYQNKGTFQTAKNIVKHRGLAGLYSGFNLHLLRDTLGTAIYFMTYESSKQLLATYSGDRSPTNPFAVLFAGGLCGVVSWALIYPIDSAKSIYQRNSLTVCKEDTVTRAPKIQFMNRRMYRGLGVSMGRSCVVNSIFFSVFEFIKKHINALED
ncbi:Mitochondrial carrier [Venustampulla echinocandica]|uniref:Mitochondrial carrier n=1 Tax=Venustampulla echinocandica TaxID=2656787 RepID=A0A370TU27_9HELO|nr:Mitochondrial carrier [Venustampulla echinocandica]RDL39029.1 Mitochondrial carrier [Venustampulla echinocandica]